MNLKNRAEIATTLGWKPYAPAAVCAMALVLSSTSATRSVRVVDDQCAT